MQERDRLTVAAEGATRLRIKNQEILAKEEQVRALLASNRSKLDSLLGTRGKGMCTGCCITSGCRSSSRCVRGVWQIFVRRAQCCSEVSSLLLFAQTHVS